MARISNEQLAQARSVDLLSWLLKHEPQSVRRCGVNEYCLVEHDSLKISNGAWFWFSKGFGGYNCLDFLVKVRGMDFVAAVQSLAENSYPQAFDDKFLSKVDSPSKPVKPFTLPPAYLNNDRVIAYLRGRGIGAGIIDHCIGAGFLYESTNHRCVFVGFDGNVPRSAFERGTDDDYKRDVAGSNKMFGFCLPPTTPEECRNLAVFESAIDCLAHFEIHRIGQTGLDGYRLSLGGVGSASLNGFLERHPETSNIQLCIDSDKVGQDAANRLINKLLIERRFQHLKITVSPPPIGKDYADCLMEIRELQMVKNRPNRRKQAAFLDL